MKINNIANNYNLNPLNQKRNNKTFNSSSALLQSDKTISSPSFTGKPKWMDAVSQFEVDKLSDVYKKAADNGNIQKLSAFLAKSNKSFIHLSVAESALLSSFYTINALTNKKIKKEQKPQMVINDILTFSVGALCSYSFDKSLGDKFNEFIKNYFEKNKDFYKNLSPADIEKTRTGLNKLKSLVIVTFVYRYLGPVLVTPFANKISSKFFDGKVKEKTQQAK